MIFFVLHVSGPAVQPSSDGDVAHNSGSIKKTRISADASLQQMISYNRSVQTNLISMTSVVGMSAYLSVFMIFVYLFGCVLVYQLNVNVCSFVDLSVCLPVYVCLSACLLACLSVCPFVRLLACMIDRQTDRRIHMQSAWDRKSDRTDRNRLQTVEKSIHADI